MGFCESRFVRCFRFKTFSCEAIREQTYLRVHRALIDRSQVLSFVDTPQRRDEDAGSKRRTVSTSKYRNSDNFEYRPYVFAYLNFCLAFAVSRNEGNRKYEARNFRSSLETARESREISSSTPGPLFASSLNRTVFTR